MNIGRPFRVGLLHGLMLASCSAAAATVGAVGPALERSALAARHPDRAVMLGLAVAGTRVVAVGERGLIVLSDDGGRHWRQAVSPTSVSLTAVRFADDRHGVAVGHGGTVLSTADLGQTWQRRLDGERIATLALESARRGTDARMVKAAERLITDGPDKPLLDVLMFDAQRLLVVGAYGLALYSDDGGQRWTPWLARLDNPKGLHLYAVRRHGDALLVVGEQGLLFRSQDGGQRFERVAAPYAGSYFTAEMLSATNWVVAGLRGNVWLTGDAGATWRRVTPAGTGRSPATLTASTRLPDGTVLLADQAGAVWQLKDDRLIAHAGATFPPLAGVLVTATGKLVVAGVGGVKLAGGAEREAER